MQRQIISLVLGLTLVAATQAQGESLPCQGDPTSPSAPLDPATFANVSTLQFTMEALGLQLDMKAVLKAVNSRNISSNSQVQVPVVIKAREPTDTELRPFTHPEFEAAGDAGLLLVFRAPSSFSMRECGRKGITASLGAGNTLVHRVTLEPRSPDGTKVRAAATETGAGTASRLQEVDAIGAATEIRVEDGDCSGSISVAARLYELIDDTRGSLLLWPVKDRTIERFHSAIGFDDPYLRRRTGMDQVRVHLKDPNGGAFDQTEDRAYFMGIRIKADRFRELFEGGDFHNGTGAKTTLNYGGQLLLPGEKPFGQAGVGLHANLTHTQQVASNWLATIGAGIGVNVQTQLLGGYAPFDEGAHFSKNGTVATSLTRIDDNRKGRTSVVVSLATQDGLLDGNQYDASHGATRFLTRQSYLAATDKENSLSLAVIRQWGANSVEIQCKEDFNRKLGRFNGNNNQDFFCGFRYRRPF